VRRLSKQANVALVQLMENGFEWTQSRHRINFKKKEHFNLDFRYLNVCFVLGIDYNALIHFIVL
jgi:hypothetical protein